MHSFEGLRTNTVRSLIGLIGSTFSLFSFAKSFGFAAGQGGPNRKEYYS